ncbi:MAG: hypothetical protein ACI4SR_05545 [Faecalibacillus sp.]
MSRLIFLVIYTVIIIGGSYLFQDASMLSTVLCLGVFFIALMIIGLLNPGLSSMIDKKEKEKNKFDETNEDLVKKHQRIVDKFKEIDYLSILTYLYLLVPFFIAIALFL